MHTITVICTDKSRYIVAVPTHGSAFIAAEQAAAMYGKVLSDYVNGAHHDDCDCAHCSAVRLLEVDSEDDGEQDDGYDYDRYY